jgi:hypothetical protein
MLVLNKFWLSLRPSSTNTSAVATVKLLPGDAIELKMTRSMRWFAGQHAYIVCPTVSKFPFEAHPFSASSEPDLRESRARADEYDVCPPSLSHRLDPQGRRPVRRVLYHLAARCVLALFSYCPRGRVEH